MTATKNRRGTHATFSVSDTLFFLSLSLLFLSFLLFLVLLKRQKSIREGPDGPTIIRYYLGPRDAAGKYGGRIDLIQDMRNAHQFNKLPGLMKPVTVIHGRLIESYLYNHG